MYNLTLYVGDPSGDGHKQCDTIRLKSNLPLEEVKGLYEKACEITGVAFEEDVLANYEENTIKQRHLIIFKKHGMKIDSFNSGTINNYIVYSSEDATNIYLEFIRVGARFLNKNLDISIYEEPRDILGSIGYGLFSN